ncbi:NifB/NifX family molybdenum-iron cluster-binding protein [Pseudoramibacter porci]|uniref:Dinitrogenase iron-molybdenum cofactor biosynthesis protein n=1 Tax=Pseudoramibacter porci TaxID=2606631 RepID=A0A7X2NHF9_9FIRM|nr:NifB/NifX family molybdenum-iron cluster-binding protein [Pseudoramibacter porci]MSS20687.1 dinitrogenase iron-molybdenum cofactor biosynthesis protein [Pseudoramibacter porci]
MKIAVSYDQGQVFDHFGKTKQFKVFDTEGKGVKTKWIVDAPEQNKFMLVGFLKGIGADVLICGKIGKDARQMLTDRNIQIFAGVSGDADAAIEHLLQGQLKDDVSAVCTGNM